jgi:beta-exotoxin I transport system ATP-binding protein
VNPSVPPLEVERLTKSYGRARGVVGLTFSVERGEIFGYLGPNGAGKTTTIRTVLDFIRPTGGRATILGLDARRDAVQIHRRIGYLPGEFGLYERFTGLEQLTYLGSLRGGVDERSLRDLVDRFDLDTGVRIASLSHGNKQKVGLIQAFMHRPELVILDEPTQGLDPLMQQEFYRVLHEVREWGGTVFLSSHVLPEVEHVCDRVGIIRDGRLAAVEDIDDLKGKALKMIEVRLASPVPTSTFERVPGVRDVVVFGDRVRIELAGPIDPLVKTLARYEVLDLQSHEPSLEEIFLTFYGGADGAG